MGSSQRKPTPEEEETLRTNFSDNCEKAAKAIRDANFFLLATGAGFSADSGLAVYKDVADVPAYRALNLTYMDLCVPSWLDRDPETFFGFWGSCFNDYRTTTPHEGYTIVNSWREKYFSSSEIFDETFKEHANNLIDSLDSKSEYPRDTVFTLNDLTHLPGPFFVLTSNVDNHSEKSGIPRNCIHQIHGTTEIWQCSKPCSHHLWKPPKDFTFTVNKETMLAPVPPQFNTQDDLEKKKKSGFNSGYPVCINPSCKALARPSILMFSDIYWVEDSIEGDLFSAWSDTVLKLLQQNPNRKMVIIEIGCGNRVPTIRHKTENFLSLEKVQGDQVTLIRINPDFPFADDTEQKDKVIPIYEKGLVALRAINQHLEKLFSEKVNS